MFHLLLSSFLLFSFLQLQQPACGIKKPYLVYLGSHSHGPKPSSADMDFAPSSHYDLLASVLGSQERAKEAIIYSYNRHINGFAALLEEHEAAEINKNPRVVSVFLSQSHQLHTTRSWGFLGQERKGRVRAHSAWVKGRFGQNVIIGSLDTGVWPESKSFLDDGYGPIPKKWRGGSKCELYSLLDPRNTTLCNRKLIGAKTFYKGYKIKHGGLDATSRISARDMLGHGTHTLSTAGGNFVQNISVQNNGKGTAKGGSPKARLAVYKVCWGHDSSEDCTDEDIISAFDQAIDDGVDIISISIGRIAVPNATDMLANGISIGSFHAVTRGILVVASAGNDGPELETVTNVAPWIFTIAAGSIDREFSNIVTLRNNQIINKGQEAKLVGALKMILQNDKELNTTMTDVQVSYSSNLPQGPDNEHGTKGGPGPNGRAAHFNFYQKKKGHPVALLNNTKTIIQIRPAPRVSAFSSRGPNLILPSILKPDVTAPGQDIIAASNFDYNIQSGTSVACPHVAGIAGLLKTRHPNWSPAMIKSAIMTTASMIGNTNRPILDEHDSREATPFHCGSGYVRPNLAMDPGLVYDLNNSDYLNFLCASAYEERIVEALNYKKSYKCPSSYRLEDFNYPSITVPFLGVKPINVTRTVTNVGPPSTYTVNVKAPKGVEVVVLPTTLTFQRKKQQKSYRVILQAPRTAKTLEASFGELTWTDGKRKVRSPIIIPQI